MPFKEKTLLLVNATEDVVSEKNKCVQLTFHYVKERKDFLDVFHVRADLMVSDILTKYERTST